jgi:hypothetical protein
MRILLFILLISTQFLFGQSANDALLISQNNIYGSARTTAMGGAFTALGGDLSAMQINPASGAIFLESQAGFSYSFSTIKNDANFYNGYGKSNKNYNNINQIGAVFIIKNDGYSSVVKFALGANYNRADNYNENLTFSGNNNKQLNVYYGDDLMYRGGSSIATSFVLNANGIAPDRLGDPEYLAFNTYLIDTNIFPDPNDPDAEYSPYYNDDYPEYSDDFPVYVMSANPENILQDYTLNRTGFSGKYNFSASLDVKNTFYLGISYNRTNINLNTNIALKETLNNSEVDKIIYKSAVNTYGNGNGFSIGAIYKPNNSLRLGATYHSPTWYNLNDEFQYELTVSNIIYGVESQKSEIYLSEYEVKSPSKIDAGIAYIFGKIGLISADYEFVDYKSMSMHAPYSLELENEEIKKTMNSTHNFKIGAEWKVSFVSLRAGYTYSQSPYRNKDWQSDTQGYSFGGGLNFKTWKLDLAYHTLKRNSQYYIYETDLVDAANIKRTHGNFVASLRIAM